MALLVLGCSDERPAAISVASAVEVGLVPQSDRVRGHDGGRSASFFGHSVWIYGDTALTVMDASSGNFHSSSFAWTDDLVAADGLSDFQERLDPAGAPPTFFPATEDEAAYDRSHAGSPCAVEPCGARWAVWPVGMAWDAPRARALVFYELVDSRPGAWSFHGVGRSVAVWSDFDQAPERPVVSPGAAHPTLLFSEGEPTYGEATAVDGDRLYTFACTSAGTDEPPCTIARVPLERVTERAAYEFWDGAAWSVEISRAATVVRAGSGLCVFRREDTWIATYARPLSNEVVARTASALTGPWSDEVLLFEADRRGDDGWTYDAYPHPELTPSGSKSLYFSFTRPTSAGFLASETALVRVDLR